MHKALRLKVRKAQSSVRFKSLHLMASLRHAVSVLRCSRIGTGITVTVRAISVPGMTVSMAVLLFWIKALPIGFGAPWPM